MQKLLALYSGTNISAADLLMISSKVERQFVKKGQVIASQGSVCNVLYVIEAGLFRCYTQEDGKDYTLFFRKEGEILTDYRSLIRKEPGQLYIQALEDGELYKLQASDLAMLFQEVPAMVQMNFQLLEKYYLRLLDDFTFLFAGDATARFKKFMLHHAEIIHRIPQHLVANYLRVTPTHLSRLKRQEQAG